MLNVTNNNNNQGQQMSKIIRIYDIEYDTDGVDVDLPDELDMAMPTGSDEEEISDAAEEYISQQTGFCHTGFQWKIWLSE